MFAETGADDHMTFSSSVLSAAKAGKKLKMRRDQSSVFCKADDSSVVVAGKDQIRSPGEISVPISWIMARST